ncbi:HlyD family efflux transporter periplasmic adaptor subunit [Desulforhopalus sp. IMCC35007]|uniref:HlyD family efflux transporter periplasmic adaptor subunit n=1 Tax=Desulforhopalus sp. IMCC35007 TaxID=2569543 RepID=UPI0010AEDE8B|nr:HlyD family efflux transporter periplasmic adaptor subunit [Desulforhopalus sp. IMCC35007]TKB06035.1 HlyD family efflux transporter periplasmic adaptor subunit [Desulforhopalus sp. IMCC35007]
MDRLTQNWLLKLCGMLHGISSAVVLVNVSDTETYTPTAFWPENLTDFQGFARMAKTAQSHGKCVLIQNKGTGTETGEPFDTIAYPLFFDGQLYGALVIQMSSRVVARQQAAMQLIEGAACWFEFIVKQQSSAEKNQLVTIVELVASCLEHERFQAAATDVMTDLTRRLSCDRVSIGFLHGQGAKIEAVSHSGRFDSRSNLIRDLGEAMYEASEQNSTIIYPSGTTEDVYLTRCHAVLVEEHRIGTILTVPFAVGGKIVGAVLAERPSDRPFDLATQEQFQHIVSMIGPVLDVRYRDEQWLPQKIYNAVTGSLGKLIGPGHIGRKLTVAATLFGMAFLSLTSADYRVTGDARLEARTQRVMAAPQAGYIASTNVRPGDVFQSGDILGALDDKDLKLEYRKWSSQLEQQQREYRDALAEHDRARVSIISARILQSRAQLNLVGEQLNRTQFTAPFDGIVVSGDLSQVLGSPVERGEVLFVVAPLIAYRVIVEIDERDIGYLKEGQPGTLVLSGMPGKPLPFIVEQVTPVSVAEEGRNFFQVEAKIQENSDLLRPGMEGVAKVNIDRRKLLWIWTHKLVDWWRLTFWSLRP